MERTDGIPLGSITELLGLPGTGKTQICLQLCAAVQVPEALGGLNAKALYIDTNTNFVLKRFTEILSATLTKCHKLLEECNMSEEEALKNVHYVGAFGLEKFCAFMYQLPKFLAEENNIRLIIIDSIAFPFKDGITAKQRTGLLFRQMAELQRLAVERQIAVVLTNEMSTRVGLSSGAVVGALGDAWAHRCNTRLLLSAPDDPAGDRLALLLKSNISPEAVAPFKITSDGIRDVN
ncbi:PREDICTED: DNA repair protein RAD51 homolog 3-like isoform X2 [Papilio polytes]|uniref:DNA repair protein RAD51 homolog 3-like isoform X2 n=1 Tax=Papilio polytes TaxID=76194 RepID=UPI00067613A7|nr:PREDICTED: DNA repair protein RAD51 homolog 3-like isoform X2 [Papilio polytes]